VRTLLIINPNAGPKSFDKKLQEISQYLIKHGHEVNQVKTKKQGDGKSFAEKAVNDNFDIVVAVGGDGTVNEVARACGFKSITWSITYRNSKCICR